ncbi:hypothetical protein D3C87_1607220 [compost metagenome]
MLAMIAVSLPPPIRTWPLSEPPCQSKWSLPVSNWTAVPAPLMTPLLVTLLSNEPLNHSPWAVLPVICPLLLRVAAPLNRFMPVNLPVMVPAFSKVPPPLASTPLACWLSIWPVSVLDRVPAAPSETP